jgi:hypothetical protein
MDDCSTNGNVSKVGSDVGDKFGILVENFDGIID